MTEDEIQEVRQLLIEALQSVDRIVNANNNEVTYETMQRAGFNRPDGWKRKYTLADARSNAKSAAALAS